MKFFWLLVLVQLFTSNVADQPKKNISIILMSESIAYQVAMEQAVQDINNKQSILTDYKLNFLPVYTEDCDTANATTELFKILLSSSVALMVVGNGCPDICLQTGLYLPSFNLCQISYQAVSTDFDDKELYPRFFRTLHSNSQFNHIRLSFMEEFHWNKVASIIVESPLNHQLSTSFQNILHNSNRSLIFSDTLNNKNELPLIFKKLKEHRAKIIFASFIEKTYAFCEIYRNKLFGPQYVWFISTYVEDWWNNSENYCTDSEFKESLEGSFNMRYNRRKFSKEETFSGKDASSIEGDELVQAAYDAVWAAAIALDKSAIELKSQGKHLEDFNYKDAAIGNIIFNNLKKVNFTGVSEQISFNNKGNIKLDYEIIQFINGKAEKVGIMKDGQDNIMWLQNVFWQGGKPPSDLPENVYTTEKIPPALTGTICLVNALMLFSTIVYFIFNLYLLQSRIALLNINMDTIFLFGVFFIAIAIFVESGQGTPQLSNCIAFRFLFFIGFSLSAGSLLAKIWRIHIICLNAYSLVPEVKLFTLIGMYLCINLIVLIIRESAHPSKIYYSNKSVEYDNGYMYITQTGYCDSPQGVYYRATLVSIQGFALCFGSYFGWETRKASFPGLRDSRTISFCLFTIMILSIAGVGIGIFVEDQKLDFAIKSFCILAAVIVTSSFIFITKIRHYRSGKLQLDEEEDPHVGKPKDQPEATPPTSMASSSLESTVTVGLDEISKVIEERNKAIDDMRIKIESQHKLAQ